MTDGSRERLLQPTLGQDARPASAPYSVQATFFTGFFGGPFAAAALVAINSSRLQRLHRDWPALAASLLLVLALCWALYGHGPALVAPARDWLRDNLGQNNYRIVYRLLAFLILGVGYLLHRREQRNADLLGIKRPNGWIAGTACALGGGALFVGFYALLRSD